MGKETSGKEPTFLGKEIIYSKGTIYGLLEGSISTVYSGFRTFFKDTPLFISTMERKYREKTTELKKKGINTTEEELVKREFPVEIRKYQEFLNSKREKKLKPEETEAVRNTIGLLEQMLNAVS